MASSDTFPSTDRDDVDALKQLVAAKDARIAILEEQLRLATVKTFAPKSEKLPSLALISPMPRRRTRAVAHSRASAR